MIIRSQSPFVFKQPCAYSLTYFLVIYGKWFTTVIRLHLLLRWGYSLDLRSLIAILLMKDVAQVLFVSDEIRFLLVPNAMIKS